MPETSPAGAGISEAAKLRKDGANGPPLVGPAKIKLLAAVAAPVPPLAIGKVPVTSVVNATLAPFAAAVIRPCASTVILARV